MPEVHWQFDPLHTHVVQDERQDTRTALTLPVLVEVVSRLLAILLASTVFAVGGEFVEPDDLLGLTGGSRRRREAEEEESSTHRCPRTSSWEKEGERRRRALQSA